jgi:capsular exopolysaccharide synthesis family protein
MELQGYLLILRARWRVVAGVLALCLLVAVGYSVTATKKYTAHSSVFLSASIGSSSSELSRSFAYAQGLVRSYAQIATQPVVLNPVIAALDLKNTPGQLSGEITAQAPLDTVIIDIRVTDRSPSRAAAIANAVAGQLSSAGPVSATTRVDLPVTVTVLAPAQIPTFASAPKKRLNLTLGLLIGLLLGAVLAIARDALDARVRGPLDAATLARVPVIGSTVVRSGRRRRLRVPSSWQHRRADSIREVERQLRANFQYLRGQRSLNTVVFTSALLDTATGATVSNLAGDLGVAGFKVLIVDADVRRSTLAEGHGISNAAGLTSILTDDVPLPSVITRSPVSPIWVLPTGPELPDPSLMLDDVAMKDLFTRLAGLFDVVLIKAPPVLRIADGLTMARVSDGVVVVTDEAAMNRDVLSEEMSALEIAGADVLGLVLTRWS